MRRVLVTVGATADFDSLVEAVLEENCLQALYSKNCRTLSIQVGPSRRYQEYREERHGIAIEVWRIKPSLNEEIKAADLVISHAGSGTILDVLRLHKPLIAVPNTSLLHNHQLELAEALESRGHLITTTPANLPTTIAEFDPKKLIAFPAFDKGKFSSLLDEIVGFE